MIKKKFDVSTDDSEIDYDREGTSDTDICKEEMWSLTCGATNFTHFRGYALRNFCTS